MERDACGNVLRVLSNDSVELDGINLTQICFVIKNKMHKRREEEGGGRREEGGGRREEGGGRREEGGGRREEGGGRREEGGGRMEEGGWRMEEGGGRRILLTETNSVSPVLLPFTPLVSEAFSNFSYKTNDKNN